LLLNVDVLQCQAGSGNALCCSGTRPRQERMMQADDSRETAPGTAGSPCSMARVTSKECNADVQPLGQNVQPRPLKCALQMPSSATHNTVVELCGLGEI